MPRTPIRGRNPEGVGRGKATRRWKKLTRRPIFILLCGLRKAMVIPAKAGIQGRRRGGTNDAQTLPATRPPSSYLGVPATARMSDWYENGVTRPQVCLNATGPRFVILAEAGIQRGGAAPMTPKRFQQPDPHSSYLGVPAPAGMSDWYGSTSRTPIRDGWFPSRPLVSSCRRPLESPRTRHSYQNMPFNQPQCRLSTGETCRIVD